MAQFVALNPRAEVNGQTVLSVANGLGPLKDVGFRILADNGLADPKPDQWYSQQFWLNAFRQISDRIGTGTLFRIGKSIPDNAVFPPEIDNIHKALAAIDVAYHMNHRLDRKVLFDPVSGYMGEGIGHYHYRKLSDNQVEIKCDNPYPCDFDRGIIEQMAFRFKPAGVMVRVSHDENGGCRKAGGNVCTYVVSW